MDNNQAPVSMEDVLNKYLEGNTVDPTLHFWTIGMIKEAMSEWTSIQCAEKDKEMATIQRLRAMDAADNQKEQYDTNEALKYWKQVAATKEKAIAQLTEAFEINKTQLMELATIATDKEAAIKELVEGLEYLMKGVDGLPPLTAIAGTLEKQYSAAKQLIQKHKV